MQTFNEGNHAAHSSDDRLLQGMYKVDIFGCIGRAWELFKQEPGMYIGYLLLLFAVYLIEQLFGKLFDFESVTNGASPNFYPEIWVKIVLMMALSILFSLAVIPLYSGVNVVGFKQMSGQKAEFGDFFHGYRYWAALIASSFVQGLIMFVALFIIAFVLGVFVFGLGLAGHSASSSHYSDLFLVLIIPIFIVTIYIGVLYVFSQSLIIDRRMGFWQAMELSRKVVNKQWFSVFGLVFIVGLLNVLGALAFVVGLLVTVPVSYLTLAVAYKEIFGLQSGDW